MKAANPRVGALLAAAICAVIGAACIAVDRASASTEQAQAILNQVTFPTPDPLAILEIDTLGNILVPVVADAVVTDDGEGKPHVAGPDIRGSRCSQSVHAIMLRTDGPFTVVCLPREYGLYERLHGRPAPTGAEEGEED